MTPAEQLILRGLHLIIRSSFSPNEPVAAAKHFKGIQDDIGPWFTDYADAIAEPELRAMAVSHKLNAVNDPDPGTR
jgi:hypothetical protein